MGDSLKAKYNPKRQLFKELYCNPESKTFGNALQSALKAGFKQEYAESITAHGTKWIEEIIRDKKMLETAEGNLQKAMDIDVKNKKIGDRSLRASMFVAKTLGKEKYSERLELTGKGGRQLIQIQDVTNRLKQLKANSGDNSNAKVLEAEQQADNSYAVTDNGSGAAGDE